MTEEEKQALELAKTNLEVEIKSLDADLVEKRKNANGLDAAATANEHRLAAARDELRATQKKIDDTKAQDASKFEAVRNENKALAWRQAMAQHPELANADTRASVESAFNSKFDSGKFNIDAILSDITVALFATNPEKLAEVVKAKSDQDRAIADQKARDAAAGGHYTPPDNSTDLTPEERELIRQNPSLSPDFIKKQRGKDSITGGLLTGKEKIIQ